MIELRLKFMLYLYERSSRVYANLFKINKRARGISKDDFAAYPAGTLGKALGDFYDFYGFDIMPKLENHDVFHVITETGTSIEDEISMQYLLLGNGKFSLYLLGMVLVGGLVFPEFIPNYMRSFRKGQALAPFHQVEFKELLQRQVQELRIALQLKTNLIILK